MANETAAFRSTVALDVGNRQVDHETILRGTREEGGTGLSQNRREEERTFALVRRGQYEFCIEARYYDVQDGRDYLLGYVEEPWRIAEVEPIGSTLAFRRLGSAIVERLPERCLVFQGCNGSRYLRAASGAIVVVFDTFEEDRLIQYLAVFFAGEYLGMVQFHRNEERDLVFRDVVYE